MQSPKLLNGDLVIDNGELVLIDGPEELTQCCEILLGTNQGEWFLNPQIGINFSKMNGKDITEETIRQQIKKGLRQEPRIQSVDQIDVQLDKKNRVSSVSFLASGTNGEVIRKEVVIDGAG